MQFQWRPLHSPFVHQLLVHIAPSLCLQLLPSATITLPRCRKSSCFSLANITLPSSSLIQPSCMWRLIDQDQTSAAFHTSQGQMGSRAHIAAGKNKGWLTLPSLTFHSIFKSLQFSYTSRCANYLILASQDVT